MHAYLRFAAIGAFIGLTAAALVALAQFALPNTRAMYLATVTFVYAGGIVLSYLLQQRFTFPGANASSGNGAKRFARFVAVAVLGGVLTGTISYGLKYGWAWPAWLAPVAGVLSFGAACFATSVLSFRLNRQWVFAPPVSE